MDFLNEIKDRAANNKKRIVLPEATEERTLRAADVVLEEGFAHIILLGDPEEIERESRRMVLKNILRATIVNPKNHENKDAYSKLLYDLRKHKGMTKEQADELVENPLYLSVLMIKNGDADGEVAGASNSTGDVLRPAFQIVKTQPGINVVSGAFIMVLKDKEFGENGIILFADGAVHPYPTTEELAEIAVSTGQTMRNILNIEPRVAMLSFSTKGSAKHELVDKVVNATKIAREKDPSLKIDGELQVDAAIIPEIAEKKAPGSEIRGNANVFIFPSLESGNIAYKLVQRLAHAEAIGPVLQGMAAPINDLSRGCSVSDIVSLVAITANQAIK
jgi:phosphate acetyltransferase